MCYPSQDETPSQMLVYVVSEDGGNTWGDVMKILNLSLWLKGELKSRYPKFCLLAIGVGKAAKRFSSFHTCSSIATPCQAPF